MSKNVQRNSMTLQPKISLRIGVSRKYAAKIFCASSPKKSPGMYDREMNFGLKPMQPR